MSRDEVDECLESHWFELELPGDIKEEWREVAGCRGDYYVSHLGRVCSTKCKTPRILRYGKDRTGIHRVCLSMDGKVSGHLVHILVANAFCGNQPDGAWVDHVNNDLSDNRASNLQWKVKTWDIARPKPTPDEYTRDAGIDIAGEIWKPVTWAPDRYFVSNMGRIYTNGAKGVPPHLMKPQLSNTGYMLMTLSKDNQKLHTTVHRLVAEEFCDGKSDTACDVNHIDGNKTNNAASNLEWVTKSENMIHARDVLKSRNPPIANPKTRIFTEDQVRAIRSDGRSTKVIADEYGVATRTIFLIRKRKTYKDVA